MGTEAVFANESHMHDPNIAENAFGVILYTAAFTCTAIASTGNPVMAYGSSTFSGCWSTMDYVSTLPTHINFFGNWQVSQQTFIHYLLLLIVWLLATMLFLVTRHLLYLGIHYIRAIKPSIACTFTELSLLCHSALVCLFNRVYEGIKLYASSCRIKLENIPIIMSSYASSIYEMICLATDFMKRCYDEVLDIIYQVSACFKVYIELFGLVILTLISSVMPRLRSHVPKPCVLLTLALVGLSLWIVVTQLSILRLPSAYFQAISAGFGLKMLKLSSFCSTCGSAICTIVGGMMLCALGCCSGVVHAYQIVANHAQRAHSAISVLGPVEIYATTIGTSQIVVSEAVSKVTEAVTTLQGPGIIPKMLAENYLLLPKMSLVTMVFAVIISIPIIVTFGMSIYWLDGNSKIWIQDCYTHFINSCRAVWLKSLELLTKVEGGFQIRWSKFRSLLSNVNIPEQFQAIWTRFLSLIRGFESLVQNVTTHFMVIFNAITEHIVYRLCAFVVTVVVTWHILKSIANSLFAQV